MTCDDLQTLLHGYVDGELDLVHQLDAEKHLESCPACARACTRLRTMQTTLQDDSFRFAPPPRLRGRIVGALQELDPIRPPRRPRLWLALTACAAVFALVAWGASFWMMHTEEDRVAQEVVASHVRSLMVDHLMDVASTDQHTVRPWFHGKLDFSPVVVNPAAEGFPLVGGRLDYVDSRVVAALVYKRRKHTINVLVWPASTKADEEPRVLTRQTYHLVRFTRGGLTTWAVSDLNQEELRDFVELLRRHNQP